MIASAAQKARSVWEALKAPIEAGRVVVIEPTDLAMFHRRYDTFLPENAAATLREHTYEAVDYVRRRGEEDTFESFRRGDGQAVAYHAHCQQRTLESVLIYASSCERSRWPANRSRRRQVVPLRASSSPDFRLIDPRSHDTIQHQNRLLDLETPTVELLGALGYDV